MHVAGLVLLAALAFADGSRVYTPPNSASARRKDRLGEIEKSLFSMALLQAQQEDQLAKTTEQLAQTRKLFQMLMEDEEAEATEKPIAETSVPPTTTTTTVTTATTRGQPPAISLKDAARYGDVAALKQHFQAGSDLNAKLGDGYYTGWTAAHYAAHYGHAAALQFLHEAGANLNATNTRGETPAYVAVLQNQTEALDALAKAGADLQKAKTYYGQTPAHLAARKGDVDALRVLIQAGVNLNVRDSAGDTPADNAKGHEEALKLILEVTTARGLLPPPAISLKEAATRGDVAALAQHRQAGSDLNAKLSDVDGWTAAHYAAHYGHSGALQFLHEAGANLNATKW